MAGTIRIGIVGAGGNTRLQHIPGFKKIAGVAIVSVVNRSRASSERVAKEFDIPRVHDTWPELVADPDIDAVMIGTWPYLHHPVTLAALAAGKHVLTEARLAMNAAQAREMLASSLVHPDLVAQVVPSPFTLAIDPTVQSLINDGYLGELQSVDFRMSTGWLNRETPMSFRLDRDLSGANIMMLGIWYESLMRWTGPAVAVTARTRVAVPFRSDPEAGGRRAVEIPDHVEVLADLPVGAIARLHMSGVAGMMPGPEVWLFGSDGTLRYEQRGTRLTGARRGETELVEIPIAEDKRAGWRVEEEFIGAIRGEEPVRLTTFADGVRYMDFTEAVTLSSREGRTIPLPLER
ncbi:MAG: Gfo/Idh/MocA family oxidoreductase [Chloroflexi bacterium]|nr:Gfo/Idh/MocA family oxidoreductase [Chloroflexota bacterium]